jgi:hypothetical protein
VFALPADPDLQFDGPTEASRTVALAHGAGAGKIRTMGQLYDFVFARFARGQAQVCVTSAAFYRLRRALGEVCGVPRERVRPRARLEDLVPPQDRPRAWQQLQARLGGPHQRLGARSVQ